MRENRRSQVIVARGAARRGSCNSDQRHPCNRICIVAVSNVVPGNCGALNCACRAQPLALRFVRQTLGWTNCQTTVMDSCSVRNVDRRSPTLTVSVNIVAKGSRASVVLGLVVDVRKTGVLSAEISTLLLGWERLWKAWHQRSNRLVCHSSGPCRSVDPLVARGKLVGLGSAATRRNERILGAVGRGHDALTCLGRVCLVCRTERLGVVERRKFSAGRGRARRERRRRGSGLGGGTTADNRT